MFVCFFLARTGWGRGCRGGEGGGRGRNPNSKTLFSKDCSLGSFRILTKKVEKEMCASTS